MKEELLNIWRCLYQNKVNYLTVGSFAMNIYGYNRNTGDIDILVEDLIKTKRACNRPKDILNIEELEKINRIK